MKILQNVVVKQILTEKSKQKLLDQYHSRLQQLRKECEQLQFELKKLEKTKKFNQSDLTNHVAKEIAVRQEKARLSEFQIEQLHMLPLGSELKEKEVQAIIDVNVGDVWDEKTHQPSIVVKDGIIEEIR
ncbi:MAG: YlqD family protein [Bacillota bacterium]|nr:YlqD family protein [Bacillota bacterium]